MSYMGSIALQAAGVFSLVNVLLAISLIIVYGDSFRKIRAEFAAGLLFFAGFLLLQNLLTLYSYVAMFMYFSSGVEMLVLGITIAQTAGLLVFLWLSQR